MQSTTSHPAAALVSAMSDGGHLPGPPSTNGRVVCGRCGGLMEFTVHPGNEVECTRDTATGRECVGTTLYVHEEPGGLLTAEELAVDPEATLCSVHEAGACPPGCEWAYPLEEEPEPQEGPSFYVLEGLPACAPEYLPTSGPVWWEPEGHYGNGCVDITIAGPSREGLVQYVVENWGDDDAQWVQAMAARIVQRAGEFEPTPAMEQAREEAAYEAASQPSQVERPNPLTPAVEPERVLGSDEERADFAQYVNRHGGVYHVLALALEAVHADTGGRLGTASLGTVAQDRILLAAAQLVQHNPNGCRELFAYLLPAVAAHSGRDPLYAAVLARRTWPEGTLEEHRVAEHYRERMQATATALAHGEDPRA